LKKIPFSRSPKKRKRLKARILVYFQNVLFRLDGYTDFKSKIENNKIYPNRHYKKKNHDFQKTQKNSKKEHFLTKNSLTYRGHQNLKMEKKREIPKQGKHEIVKNEKGVKWNIWNMKFYFLVGCTVCVYLLSM
jgi:hypothetical protein